jgi:uncharacterized repeat protein (TIGR04076 family)
MVDEAVLTMAKDMLGYNEEQWKTWKSNPKNLEILEHFQEFEKYRVVAEIKSSYGCAAGHKVGDRIVFGGDGTLLCKENPEKVCFGILSSINPMMGAIMDNIYGAVLAGSEPAQPPMNKVHCIDVGVDQGGWGEVVAEVKVEKI